MDSSRSWAGRRQCPLSCQAKGRSNRIKKSSPLFIISQDETRDNPGICGDKAGQWKTQWDCGWVTAEKPKTNTSTETHWEVLSEKFHSQWIIGIKSSWKVNVYTRTYRWRWAKKRCKNYENIVTSAQQPATANWRASAQDRKDRQDEAGPERTGQLQAAIKTCNCPFRSASNWTAQEPKNHKKDEGLRGRTSVRGFARQVNIRIAGTRLPVLAKRTDIYIYVCMYIHIHLRLNAAYRTHETPNRRCTACINK